MKKNRCLKFILALDNESVDRQKEKTVVVKMDERQQRIIQVGCQMQGSLGKG